MRQSRLALALLIVLVMAGGVVAWQTWRTTPTSGAPGQTGWVSTQWGPLGPADRDLIIRVRLAGLWEHPVGQQMVERAQQDKVREAGAKISKEHLELDVATVEVAHKLGVALPNQPLPQQRAWMDQISKSTGAAFDWTAVNLLRQAHGQILPTIINVRVSTRNSLVRDFAERGAQFVTRHINYLEDTGLVDYDRLDEAPTPSRAVVTRAGQYENVPVALLALGSIVVLGGIGALLFKVVGDRRTTRRNVGTTQRREGPSP